MTTKKRTTQNPRQLPRHAGRELSVVFDDPPSTTGDGYRSTKLGGGRLVISRFGYKSRLRDLGIAFTLLVIGLSLIPGAIVGIGADEATMGFAAFMFLIVSSLVFMNTYAHATRVLESFIRVENGILKRVSAFQGPSVPGLRVRVEDIEKIEAREVRGRFVVVARRFDGAEEVVVRDLSEEGASLLREKLRVHVEAVR